MPHIKISKLNSQDNYKEIIVFDGEITEEQNKRLNNFFYALDKAKEKMKEKIIKKMNAPEFKSKIEKMKNK